MPPPDGNYLPEAAASKQDNVTNKVPLVPIRLTASGWVHNDNLDIYPPKKAIPFGTVIFLLSGPYPEITVDIEAETASLLKEFERKKKPPPDALTGINLIWRATERAESAQALAQDRKKNIAPAFSCVAANGSTGEMMKSAREAQGLSQVEVAKAMGTSQSFISKIENGKHIPTSETFAKYGEAIGLVGILGYSLPD